MSAEILVHAIHPQGTLTTTSTGNTIFMASAPTQGSGHLLSNLHTEEAFIQRKETLQNFSKAILTHKRKEMQGQLWLLFSYSAYSLGRGYDGHSKSFHPKTEGSHTAVSYQLTAILRPVMIQQHFLCLKCREFSQGSFYALRVVLCGLSRYFSIKKT